VILQGLIDSFFGYFLAQRNGGKRKSEKASHHFQEVSWANNLVL
jgi:hypothetical protein